MSSRKVRMLFDQYNTTDAGQLNSEITVFQNKVLGPCKVKVISVMVGQCQPFCDVVDQIVSAGLYVRTNLKIKGSSNNPNEQNNVLCFLPNKAVLKSIVGTTVDLDDLGMNTNAVQQWYYQNTLGNYYECDFPSEVKFWLTPSGPTVLVPNAHLIPLPDLNVTQSWNIQLEIVVDNAKSIF
jgi:hypothetical protein